MPLAQIQGEGEMVACAARVHAVDALATRRCRIRLKYQPPARGQLTAKLPQV